MSIMGILVAWGILGVIIYVVADTGQGYLYNGAADGLWWRAIVTALPLAALLLKFPCSLDVMFTDYLLGTIFQPLAWFLLFWLVCQFHAGHAAIVGVTSFFLFGFIVTMALHSLGLVAEAGS